MRALATSFSLLTAACGAGEGPFVEPRIEKPTATRVAGRVSGSFVLSLYLPRQASSSSEVFLYSLQNTTAAEAVSEIELPVVIEPGELLRVPIRFTVPESCPLTLTGTIHDTLKGGLTTTTGPSANCR